MTKICKKCKIEYPATTEYFWKDKTVKCGLVATCKNCRKEYKKINEERIKANRQLTKERLRETQKKWRQDNLAYCIEHDKIRFKEYYKKNCERLRESSKKYAQENAESIKNTRKVNYQKNKPTQTKYSQENKERINKRNRQWRHDNPEKTVIHKQTRRTKESNLPANLTWMQWENIILYFDNKCAYCGRETKLTQDHFIPLSKNGEYTINNIIPSCKNCNSNKWTKDFFEWYPTYKYFDKKREQKILTYLNYNNGVQQLSLTGS